MRALPLVERVLLVGCAILVTLLLAFFYTWHVRWRGILTTAAAIPAHRGVAVPPVTGMSEEKAAALRKDFSLWLQDAVASWSGDATRVPGWDGQAHGWWVVAAPFTGGLAGGAAAVNILSQTGQEPAMDAAVAARLAELLKRGLRIGDFAALTPGEIILSGEGREVEPTVVVAMALERAALRWRIDAAGGAAAAGRALDAFDALDAACGERLAQQDLIARVRILRDAAYVDAQMAGTISAERLARWRAEGDSRTGDPLVPVLAGLDLDRRWEKPKRSATYFGRGPFVGFGDGRWRDASLVRWAVGRWWHEPAECVTACDGIGADLDAIDAGDGSRVIGSNLDRNGNRIGYDEIDASNFLVEVNAHRFARLASAIAAAWAAGKGPEQAGLDLAASPRRIGVGGGAALTMCHDLDVWTIAVSATQAAPLGNEWGAPDGTTDAAERSVLAAARGRWWFAWSGDEMVVRVPDRRASASASVPPGEAVVPHQATMILKQPIRHVFPRLEQVEGLSLQISHHGDASDWEHAAIVGDMDMIFQEPVPVKIVGDGGKFPEGGNVEIVVVAVDEEGCRLRIRW